MSDLPYIKAAQEVKITGQDATGNQINFVSADASGNMAVIPGGRTVSGSITSGSNLSINTTGMGAVLAQITGTWTGSIQFQVSIDNSTWIAASGIDVVLLSNQAPVSTSINGQFAFNVAGLNFFRLLGGSNTGTATVNLCTSPNTNTITAILANVFSEQAGTWTVRNQDASGNNLNSTNNQLQVTDVLNVSSQYRAQSITTSAAEALGAATILVNRKMITITPTNGTIYFGTNSSVTTATGTPIFPNNTLFLDVTNNVHIFVIAAATTDCRIVEFS